MCLSKIIELKPGASSGVTAEQEKVSHIRGEVISSLEDRIEELRGEAERIQRTMTEILARIKSQGFRVRLDDLRSGQWYRKAAEVRVLQEILEAIEANDD
jgi:hypothetical protein